MSLDISKHCQLSFLKKGFIEFIETNILKIHLISKNNDERVLYLMFLNFSDKK